MNIETLKKEEFETIKALSEMSLKISEARQTLTELKNTETKYIAERENKVVAQIQTIFDKSDSLVKQINKNHKDVNQLYLIVSEYKEFIEVGYNKFTELLNDFNERSTEWDLTVKDKYEEFSRLEDNVKQSKESIKRDFELIEKQKEEIRKEKIKLEDKQQIIKRTVERLKNKQI
jgi:chromosome segregation ATPase